MLKEEIIEAFQIANIELYQNDNPHKALDILQYLERSLSELSRSAEDPFFTDAYIKILAQIGNVYIGCLQPQEGESYLLEARKYCRNLLNKERASRNIILEYIGIERNFAVYKTNWHKYDDAEFHLNEAISICDRYLDGFTNIEELFQYTTTLAAFGNLYRFKGDYHTAQMHYRKSEGILNEVFSSHNLFNQEIESLELDILRSHYFEVLLALFQIYMASTDLENTTQIMDKAYRLVNYIPILSKHNDINYMNASMLMMLHSGRGMVYGLLGELASAKKAYEEIEKLTNVIKEPSKNRFNPMLLPHIVGAKIGLGEVLYGMGNHAAADEKLKQALDMLGGTHYFPSLMVVFIIRITRVYKKLLPVDIRHVFNRMLQLLLPWHDLQVAETPEETAQYIREFWQEWIDFALKYNDSHLLFDILANSHARRQISLLNANWMAAENLDTDIRQFVELRKQLHAMELQLLSLEQALQSNPQGMMPQYETLLAEHRTLHQEWLRCRNQLVSQQRYPDVNLSRIDAADLQAGLDAGEAVLLSFSVKDFGLGDAPPYFLLVRRDGMEVVQSPEIEAASQAMRIITTLQTRQARRSNLRHSGLDAPDGDAFFEPEPPDADEVLRQLQDNMSIIWRKLNPRLTAIKRLSIIGHGQFHTLPWQDSCPVQQNSFFPGLHAYLQRKKTMSLAPPMPSSACPVHVLAYAAENRLGDRLYYIPAEIDAIRAVWGDAAVRVITDLDEFSNVGYLFLLGHGNFDQETGNARFTLKDRHVEAHELLTLRPKLLGLGASACLLGQTLDISSEPLGLFSLCANRPDIQFSYGSILPVSDIGAMLLTLHFHYQWRRQGSPHAAFRLALAALRTGQWPEEARDIFRTVMVRQMPTLFRALEDDRDAARGNKVIEQRINNVKYQWMCNRDDYIRHYKAILDDRNSTEQKQEAADKLVEGLLERLLMQQPEANFGDFAPFWLYG